MTVFMVKTKDRIEFSVRAEGEGAVGDLFASIKAEESAFGRSYDEWAALPEGAYQVP